MRFYGAVGFAESVETAPGVWSETITERFYYGDVVRNSRRLVQPSPVPPVLNVGLALENSFSIVADAEAYASFMQIRYVEWEGQHWQVTNAEVKRPRLILTIGELWNGNTP
jgi:hypothetical protein